MIGKLPYQAPLSRQVNPSHRLSVGFILADKFTLCAFANFVDVLRLAADEGDRSRPILCNWTVLSDNLDSITSSSGVSVKPHALLSEDKSYPTKFDYIVVVGGLMNEMPNLGKAYSQYLTKATQCGVPLIGVCSGTFFLHQAGFLAGYKACVSWFHHADFLEQFDGLNPISDQIFVVDRDRITCSGGASSAHLAAHLVEKHVGRAQANKSLHIMIIDEALRADMPQPSTSMQFKTKDPLVRRALLMMQQNIDGPITIEEIAKRIGSSKRKLERHFAREFQLSPQAAFGNIRLSLAYHLITQTDRSVAQIALDCGYCDSSHLSRRFKKEFGQTPSAVRAI